MKCGLLTIIFTLAIIFTTKAQENSGRSGQGNKSVKGNAYTFKPHQPDTTTEECQRNREKAINDYESGTYLIKFQKNYDNSPTYIKVLEERYGINAGYVSWHFNNCYDLTLKQLVQQKYGEDIFEKALALADSLDATGGGNRTAVFASSNSNIIDYLKSNLSEKERKYFKKKYNGNIIIKIKINEEGVTYIYSVVYNRNIIYEPVFARIIDGNKLYKPATKRGRPVDDMVIVHFNTTD